MRGTDTEIVIGQEEASHVIALAGCLRFADVQQLVGCYYIICYYVVYRVAVEYSGTSTCGEGTLVAGSRVIDT